MPLRNRIDAALKDALRARDAVRLSTLRLMSAAIKDRDIALRGEGRDEGAGDAEVLAILARMVKQRQESARLYEEGGRLDMAEEERHEIGIIEEFLPRPLGEGEVDAAIEEAMAETGARGVRDMGRVMASLKGRYAGRMDFGRVGPMVRARLTA